MDRAVFYEVLHANAATDEATGVTLGSARVAKIRELTVYVLFNVGTTAGVVTVEGAPYAEYAGVWVSLGTATWAAAEKAHSVAVTGVHGAIRARISTAIAGGDGVTVIAVGN